jgi:type I restriction enzyme M protein
MQVVNTKNQCFVVWSNEIEGRFDPHFYKPEFRDLTKKIRTLKYKTKQIKDFADIICGPFGSSIKVNDYKTSGIPLIRIANITKSQELTPDNTIFITKELAEKLKSYRVKRGDLIVSQRGTLGLVAKIPDFFDGGIISANFIAIKDIKEASSDYLKFFLSSKYGQEQLVRKTSGQVQTKITTDDIKSIIVPIPPLQIQNQIVEIMQSAYKQKMEKEKEAEKLLNSIDDYVLDELGIKMPEIKDKMCFSVNSENLNNNRIDTTYWKPRFQIIEKILKNSRFPIKGLTEITKIQRGVLIPPKKYEMGKQKYIRIANLKNLEINPFEVMQVGFKDNKGKVSENDILFTAIGATIGKVALVDSRFAGAYFSNNLTKITPTKVNPFYLMAFLSGSLGQEQVKRYSTQTAQPKINDEELTRIQILTIPSLTIQNRIAEEVKNRIEKAKKLKLEAKNIIKNAKNEVEKIILDKTL